LRRFRPSGRRHIRSSCRCALYSGTATPGCALLSACYCASASFSFQKSPPGAPPMAIVNFSRPERQAIHFIRRRPWVYKRPSGRSDWNSQAAHESDLKRCNKRISQGDKL
jgi:hypothetical protein